MAALAAAPLASCKTVDRAVFLTFTGEAPGDRASFVEIAGAQRLGRKPPALSSARFRPAITPNSGSEPDGGSPIINAYDRVRQSLSDRDDEFSFRMRSLSLYSAAYLEVASDLNPAAGDPLPANDAVFKAGIKAARDALDDIDSGIAKLNNLIALIQRDLAAVQSVAAAVRGRDGALAASADASVNTASRLLKAARRVVGDYVVYVSGQRDILNRIKARTAKATGADTVRTIRSRKTLIQ